MAKAPFDDTALQYGHTDTVGFDGVLAPLIRGGHNDIPHDGGLLESVTHLVRALR